MKSELINLLDRLKNHPGPGNGDNPVQREHFQGITIFPDGTAHGIYRWGLKRFRDLDQLEALAYPDSASERGLQAASARNEGESKPLDGRS